MGKGKNGLPDRWLDYKSIGQEIRGVPIIACKVPLKEKMLRNRLQQEQWFTPDKLVEMVPNVGCIVDLTATNRYYDPSVFTKRGIQHAKIHCEGRVIPKSATVNSFFEVVDEFLHNIHSRGKVLMVHCTHGLNRTGYLVSRYMVERRGFQPKDAIEAFNYARGHNIERCNYLWDLRQMTKRVCPNPLPLFQKSDSRPSLLEEAAACFDGSTSSSGYNLRSSGLRNQPSPFLDHHRHFPPPVSHSNNERPSSVNQPSERRPSHGQHQSKKRQGTRTSSNSSPMPPAKGNLSHQQLHQDVLEVPSVPMHADRQSQPPTPAFPLIDKTPNSKWIVADLPQAQLNNCDDQPSSSKRKRKRNRKRTNVNRQSVSVHQARSTPPVNDERKKKRRNKSSPPSLAPKSEYRDGSHRQKFHQSDSSIEILSTSSIEMCYDSRKVEPSAQQKSKVHPLSGRPKHQAPEKTGTPSPTSTQELPPPDHRPSGKKKRSRGRKGGAGRSNEAPNPSAERT